MSLAEPRRWLVEDQDGGGDYGGPQAALIADGGLGDVGGADDFVGEAVDLLLFVPGTVGIELDVQSSGQHFGGEFFGVFSGRIFGLTEGMMFAEIAVGVAVGGDGDT